MSSRFGDIFRINSTRSGLVPAEVDEEAARALMDLVKADPDLELTIDVDRRTIEVPASGDLFGFRLDDDARFRLLNGLDDIGVTMQHLPEIDDFESHRASFLPGAATGG